MGAVFVNNLVRGACTKEQVVRDNAQEMEGVERKYGDDDDEFAYCGEFVSIVADCVDEVVYESEKAASDAIMESTEKWDFAKGAFVIDEARKTLMKGKRKMQLGELESVCPELKRQRALTIDVGECAQKLESARREARTRLFKSDVQCSVCKTKYACGALYKYQPLSNKCPLCNEELVAEPQEAAEALKKAKESLSDAPIVVHGYWGGWAPY